MYFTTTFHVCTEKLMLQWQITACVTELLPVQKISITVLATQTDVKKGTHIYFGHSVLYLQPGNTATFSMNALDYRTFTVTCMHDSCTYIARLNVYAYQVY